MEIVAKTASSASPKSLGWKRIDAWEPENTSVLLEDPPTIGDAFYAGDEWQLACRIAASKGMSKSDLLPRFLLHICELSLSGRSDQISEQRIGTQIFNRPADYNPAEDNIVRSYARTMRKRVDEYFATEGRDEKLRLSIPRGGYVPVFEPAFEPTFEGEPSDPAATITVGPEPHKHHTTAEEVPTTAASSLWSRAWVLGLSGLLLGSALATAGWFLFTASRATHPHSIAHPVWVQLFQPNRSTLIVPADSGLGILQNLSRRSITVDQYANGSYMAALAAPAGVDEGNFNDIGRQRYTSVVDLDIASRLLTLPEITAGHAQVRYARSVTAEDIKDSNAVLLGSKHTDPWVALFEKSMNFTLEYTSVVDDSYILNHHPKDTEQPVYRNLATDAANQTYGVIAFLPSLDGNGHVLIIEGLNMAATQAAAEVLFNEKEIGPILKAATQPDGSLRPFELLVATKSVGATSPGAQIIARRIG